MDGRCFFKLSNDDVLPPSPSPPNNCVNTHIQNFSLLHVLWVELSLGSSPLPRRMVLVDYCLVILKLLKHALRLRKVDSITVGNTEMQVYKTGLGGPV